MTLKRIVTKLEKERKLLATRRDNIRLILEELEALDDSAERGLQLLDDAIDALSEYV